MRCAAPSRRSLDLLFHLRYKILKLAREIWCRHGLTLFKPDGLPQSMGLTILRSHTRTSGDSRSISLIMSLDDINLSESP